MTTQLTLPLAGLRSRTAGILAGACLALLTLLPLAAPAAQLIADATLVASDAKPVSRTFTVTKSGTYQLTVTDVGFPANLVRLQAAVTRDDRLVAKLNAAGVVSFVAEPGIYELQVAGLAASATGFGTFAANVTSAALGETPLDYSDVIENVRPASTPSGQLSLQTKVTITTAGRHRISLADLAFPRSLASISLLLTRSGAQLARLDATTTTADFDVAAGDCDLLVVARAVSGANAGLFGVRVANLASGALAFDKSYPVGALGTGEAVTLPGGGGFTLAVADLAFPVALQSAEAVLVQGSQLLVRVAAGGSAAFAGQAGEATLYALPLPRAPAVVGAMSAAVRQGGSRVKSGVYVVTPDPATAGTTLSNDTIALSAAGSPRVTLTDFQFPTAFASLELGVFQEGAELGRRAGPGTLDVSAAAGAVTILVATSPASSGSGLYGVQVESTASGPTIFEATRAAGSLFEQRTVAIASGGSYDVTISDLGFPANFAELATAVTRGTQRVGFVFGSGKFSFPATPGEYTFSFITRLDPTLDAGTYGLKVEDTPPPPAVTLTASPATIKAGESTTLTWSASTATSCVASGQWSGSKATSGTQSVGPLSAQATFDLACSGPGGTTSKSVVVEVKKASSSGGGGSGESLWPLLLLLAALRPVRRQPSTS